MVFDKAGAPIAGPWGKRPRRDRSFARRMLAGLGVAALLLLALLWVEPPASLGPFGWASVVRALLVLAIVVTGVAASRRRLSQMAVDLAIWLAIGVTLAISYGYRFELREMGDRVLAELIPAHGRPDGEHAMSFRRSNDQQFWVAATVDGKAVRFVVDTGASGVVLTKDDASRLGFDPDRLDYVEAFQTANGTTHGAPVMLGHVRIGSIEFEDVPATVNQGELSQSLLGMRLLERLSRIEISKDTLTIRQ
jgi:aspartyl protease family protein